MSQTSHPVRAIFLIFKPFLDQTFWELSAHFWRHFLTNFLITFWIFWGGFEALWVPLESLLGSLEALLGGLRTQKPSNTGGFLRFLKMQLFGSLKLLMALLGSSCPLFGRSGPKMASKMAPKSDPKSDQKVVQKMTPKMTKK